MCNTKGCNCIEDILKTILILQKNQSKSSECLETCDKLTLGPTPVSCELNTRPFMLKLCDNNFLRMPISKDPEETIQSKVFRVEKVDDCCATCRVLKLTDDTVIPFEKTESFFTVNLKCCCVIKCLDDTFVDCI